VYSRHAFFLRISFLVACVLAAATGAARAQDTSTYAAEVLRLVNQERAAQSPPLAPLTLSTELRTAAQNYAQYMGEAKFFSHTGLDGSTPGSRITAAGYHWTAYGENIAAGQPTPSAVMTAWMNSSGHRANILNSRFREIGIGVAVVSGSEYNIYWVQDFGDRNDVSLPAQPAISSVDPVLGVRGERLTLYGSNLGGSGSVIFTTGVAGVVSAWSPNRVDVMVPGQAQSGSVYVQTSAGVSNVVALQVTDPPPPPVLPGFAPRHRIAVFRPGTLEWFLRGDDGSTTQVQFGGPGDQPVPADYLGTGKAQIAVFRPSTREWFIRTDSGGAIRVEFGGPGDVPVPADYTGLRRAQIAVFRPSTQEWFLRRDDGSATKVTFGSAGDQPVPADYFGLRRAQIAVFRPSTAQWLLRTDAGVAVTITWGVPGDRPVPGDYLALGRAQIAVFRPNTAEFFLRNDQNQSTRIPFGVSGDIPVPGDYNGIGRFQFAVYRPSTAQWLFRADNGTATAVQFGGLGDQPVPAVFAFRFGLP
jgi:putative transposon-encoded protein